MKEKRKEERISKKVKSEVHSLEGMTFSTSEDLSSGGIFITTPDPIMVGSEMSLSLYIPNEKEPLNIKGVVRWMVDDSDTVSKAGMGIEFIDASDEEIGKIKKIID